MPKEERLNMRIEVEKKDRLKEFSDKYFGGNMTDSVTTYIDILDKIEKICDFNFNKDINKCLVFMVDNLESKLERGE